MGFSDIGIVKTSNKWKHEQYPQFISLFEIDSVKDFSQAVSQIANDAGFERYIFRLLPNKHNPINKAFVITNHAHKWQEIYDRNQYFKIAPTIQHCYSSHFPLFWDKETFTSAEQKFIYVRGLNYGLSSGLAFPIHGPNGEFGMMSLATKKETNDQVKIEAIRALPHLSVFVTLVFELSKNFIHKKTAINVLLA